MFDGNPYRPTVVDTALPPKPVLGSMKPVKATSIPSGRTISRLLNSTLESINMVAPDMAHQLKAATVDGSGEALDASLADSAASTMGYSKNASAIPWTDELSRMTTTFFTERASHLSILHLIGWVLLFATLAVMTVVLLNWFLSSRQDAHDEETEMEEMHIKAAVQPSSSSTQGVLTEGSGSVSSSSSRLLASRGNLARQQFLESRKANGAGKDYGTTNS